MKTPRNNTKRQISFHKFQRVAKDPRSVKVRGLYSTRLEIPEMEMALEAYKMDDFLYMWRKCKVKNQTSNRVKTYFVRYKLNSLISTQEYVISGGRTQ